LWRKENASKPKAIEMAGPEEQEEGSDLSPKDKKVKTSLEDLE
jgi:hypothetical protein